MATKLFELDFVLKAVEHLSRTVKKIETHMEAVGAMAGAGIAIPLNAAIVKASELEDHIGRFATAIGSVPDKARHVDEPETFAKEQSIAGGYEVNQFTGPLYHGVRGFLNMAEAMGVSVEAAKLVRGTTGDLTATTSLAALSARGLSSETVAESLPEIMTQMSRASTGLGLEVFAGPNAQGIHLLKTLPGIDRQFGDISKHKNIAAAFEKAFGARAELIGTMPAPVIGAIRHGGAALISQTFEWGVSPLKTLADRLLARSEQASLRAALKTFAVEIWGRITRPIRAMERQGSVIFNHFKMHSPAKLGPLRDLHRVRVVETIAQAIKPAPMLSAIRRVAAVASVTMPMMIGGAALPAAGATSRPFRSAAFADSLATASQARPVSGAVVLNYAPHVEVHAPGGDAATIEKAVMETLERNRREVYRMLEQVASRRERTRY